MNSLEINRAITAVIKEKIPNKSKIVSTLSEILDIGTKAVYRRLNDEVFFTFSEVCKLSSRLGISLDQVFQNTISNTNSSNILSLPDNKEAMHKLVKRLFHIKQNITKISQYAYSEMGSIINGIPPMFYCYDKELLAFISYYTNYQYTNIKTYSEFKKDYLIQPVIDEIYNIHIECLNVKYHYILISRDSIKALMEAMNYMKSIHSLTDDEYNNFKRIIKGVVGQLEKITNSGNIFDSDAKCDIYLLDVKRYSTCYYVWCEDMSASSMQMYLLGRKISLDHNYNCKIRKWLDLWRNNAVLITKSNINERIHFFESQYEVLDLY